MPQFLASSGRISLHKLSSNLQLVGILTNVCTLQCTYRDLINIIPDYGDNKQHIVVSNLNSFWHPSTPTGAGYETNITRVHFQRFEVLRCHILFHTGFYQTRQCRHTEVAFLEEKNVIVAMS